MAGASGDRRWPPVRCEVPSVSEVAPVFGALIYSQVFALITSQRLPAVQADHPLSPKPVLTEDGQQTHAEEEPEEKEEAKKQIRFPVHFIVHFRYAELLAAGAAHALDHIVHLIRDVVIDVLAAAF